MPQYCNQLRYKASCKINLSSSNEWCRISIQHSSCAINHHNGDVYFNSRLYGFFFPIKNLFVVRNNHFLFNDGVLFFICSRYPLENTSLLLYLSHTLLLCLIRSLYSDIFTSHAKCHQENFDRIFYCLV
jgi:hypothetical protein